MKLSYEGIGQWSATFASANVTEGELVKLSENGTVATCTDGDDFCAMVLSVGRGGDACSAALGGMVTAGFTGTAPAVGWSALASDGAGGCKTAAAARKYLVVDVDSDGKTVTFVL